MSRHRLDVRGLLCPVPLLMTARAMSDLVPGDRLEVLGDDPEMERDIPAWCEESGNCLLAMEHKDGSVRCEIERREAGRFS